MYTMQINKNIIFDLRFDNFGTCGKLESVQGEETIQLKGKNFNASCREYVFHLTVLVTTCALARLSCSLAN